VHRMPSSDRVSLVYHPDLLKYDFGPQHPLRPERIGLGLDLLRALDIWDEAVETCVPRAAPDGVLELIHDSAYVAAVRAAEHAVHAGSHFGRFGLTGSDNPPFPNMHYAASLVAGGAADATRAVMRHELDHAFHPAGGLHHAQRSRASGFCIYNDPALAAAVAVEEFGARVAYIDFDCHHGDGVQWLFYDEPSVLTVSFHESGRFLFPGTGEVEERGEGDGEGYTANVPFMPFTEDASWLTAIHALVPPLVERFAPDLLLTVHGCDTHVFDPLTHLSLTTDAFVNQAQLVHELAHTQCDGRWIAFGSGGYDWRRVVPRSWAIVWSEMSGRTLPLDLPPGWLARWSSDAQEPLPKTFRDNPDEVHSVRRDEIESANRETLARAMAAAGIG
jgi:acetoin utilization protein AcuC